MIDTPAFDDVPEFSHDGTNVKPGTAKYSGGFVSNEMLPFDFFNWFMHGLTKNGAAEQVDIGSIHAELKSVLTAHGVTPNPALSNQLAGVFGRFIYGSGIYGSTSITDANSIVKSGFYSLNTPYTGGPAATAYHIMHIEGADGTNAYQIAYNNNTFDSHMRRRNNTTWSIWAKIWNSANDGAGSGLDADLFDGLDSSRFVFGEATNATIVYSTGSANNIAKSGFYRVDTAVTAKPVAGACHIIHLQSTASADYATQFGVPQAGGSFYFRSKIAASWSAWVAVKNWDVISVQAAAVLSLNALNIIDPTNYPGELALTLPAANVGDTIEIECLAACKITQSDDEHVISWNRSIFTTKGVNGLLKLKPRDIVKLTYKGTGFSLRSPGVKITNPASLPTGNGRGAAWSPDGRYLAVAHYATPYVTIYDWSTGVPVKIANPATLPTAEAFGVAWSPDGRYLAVAHNTTPFATIYDWSTGVPVKIADPATLPVGGSSAVVWSPDGRYLAFGHGSSPYITIYDWISGSPVKISNPATLPGGNSPHASWSPDGRYLVTGPALTIYDWISGLPVKIADPATMPSGTYCSAWSPDGRYLALALASSTILAIYDFISGSPVKVPNPATLPTADAALGVSWSPDGRFLAIAHWTTPFITIYDWIAGYPVKIANPASLPTGNGYGVTWSPDGRYLVDMHDTTPYETIYDFRIAATKEWMVDIVSQKYLRADPGNILAFRFK
jgi:WD40 repeat protein